jgi:formate hydrogenlyase subunit 4
MGAAREVSYAVLTEAAILAAVLSLSVQTGSTSLVTMLAPSAGAGAVLLAAGLFTVLLAENCRVPFDDPNTHLELTMIHEVMVLDHSGPPFGLILYGAALKLFAYGLFVEHFQEFQTVWNGDRGAVYFYQSELPYDPP